MLTKLTLSVEKDTVASARRLARKNRTSISSMFARFTQAVADAELKQKIPIAPITRKATGTATLPKGTTDVELLEDALFEKYGARK